jgi:hypothetical protein
MEEVSPFQRERRKILGINGTVPNIPEDIPKKLPDQHKTIYAHGTFLRHMETVGMNRIVLMSY